MYQVCVWIVDISCKIHREVRQSSAENTVFVTTVSLYSFDKMTIMVIADNKRSLYLMVLYDNFKKFLKKTIQNCQKSVIRVSPSLVLCIQSVVWFFPYFVLFGLSCISRKINCFTIAQFLDFSASNQLVFLKSTFANLFQLPNWATTVFLPCTQISVVFLQILWISDRERHFIFI